MADDEQDGGATVRRLLTTPPGEFVAERNRLAKALKADGERDAATAISALRRPSVTDWALNVLAGEQRDEVDAFVDAATDVQEAQAAAIEGRAGTDIREAVRLLRERTAALVALARTIADKPGIPAAGSSVGELTARLAEIAGSAQATASLRVGLLGVGEAGGADPFGGLDVPERPPRRGRAVAAKTTTTKKTQGRGTAEAKGVGDDKAAKQAAAEQAQAEARRARVRDLADAERARTRAAKQLDRSGTDVARLTAAVEKAQAAYDDAAKRREVARTQLDESEARRSKAADAVAAAESAVTEAQRAVDADR